MSIDWRSLSSAELLEEIKAGGRLISYSYCIAVLFMSFKRQSRPRLIRAGRSATIGALPWIAATLFGGWWGIPWGPIWSIQCIVRNMRGGYDMTDRIVDALL
jgi:hypothetical protein